MEDPNNVSWCLLLAEKDIYIYIYIYIERERERERERRGGGGRRGRDGGRPKDSRKAEVDLTENEVLGTRTKIRTYKSM